MTSNEFKTFIEEEARKRGCSTTTLCGKAVGNNRLYRNLAGGGSCTLDIAARFKAYVEANPAPAKRAA
jgi:hypothetical protein